VSSECPYEHFPLDIIDLHLALRQSDCQMISLWIEGERADILIIFLLDELSDASRGIEVDLVIEPNRQRSSAAPIEQVQVVIISNLRRIEHLFGREVYILLGGLFQDLLILLGEEVLDSAHAVVAVEGVLILLIEHGLSQDLLGEQLLIGRGVVLGDHGLVELAHHVFVVGSVGDEAVQLSLLGTDAVLHLFVKL
jgi:hypothetical protein